MAKKIIDREIIDIAKKYVKEVCKNYKIEAIILFGSYAKGTYHVDSDIDIAVITDDFTNNKFDEEVNLRMLIWEIDLRIEPHLMTNEDYQNITAPYIKDVIDNGIKIA